MNDGAGAYLTRLELENFRSFRDASADLRPMTVIVGPNSAGKTNFLDALRFVTDALRDGLPVAVDRRGGFETLRFRPASLRATSDVRVDLRFRAGQDEYSYGMRLGQTSGGGWHVRDEACVRLRDGTRETLLGVSDGVMQTAPAGITLKVDPRFLVLPLLSGLPDLEPVSAFLTRMRWCAIDPMQLRGLTRLDDGSVLDPHGANAASVMRALNPASTSEIVAILRRLVPGLLDVRAEVMTTGAVTLLFDQDDGRGGIETFDAALMSDGTLRLLGMLVALHQPERPSVLTIDEPELGLHFAATQAAVEAFAAHMAETQILFSTHSADVVDAVDIDAVRVVREQRGSSVIDAVAEHSAASIREQLFTAGELLRAGGLRGATEDLAA